MTILSFFIVIFFWQTPSLISFTYIFFAAISGSIFHIIINHTYKLVDVSMTQPFSFAGLLLASFYGYFIFDEKPDFYTWVGAVVIFLGILIITIREVKLNKDLVRSKLSINS